MLAGYILLVGPVNYFVLRWRDRLAWAWITIPTLTLAFSALAYGIVELGDPVARERLLAQAIRELMSWRRRFNDINEFDRIYAEIDAE